MSGPVQIVSAEDPNTGSFGTTISVVLPSVHAGAPIWVAAGHFGNPNDPSNLTITVDDGVNGTWTTPLLTSVERAFDCCTYTFGLASSGAGSLTITVSFPGTGSLVGKWIVASEGPVGSVLSGTSFLDQTNPTAGTADAGTSGTVSNTAQPGYIISYCYGDNDFTGPGPAAGTGFTDDGVVATFGQANSDGRIEHKAVTTLGVAATYTRPSGAAGTDNGYIAHAAIYADASGATSRWFGGDQTPVFV